ncbi:APC family permease [Amnibacterium endophyticum]|uniref:APC family permease n=1 Tax=Amnibacterium endophyticum TaxID=2109337 RepID=A0ABW4LBI0_9MICO
MPIPRRRVRGVGEGVVDARHGDRAGSRPRGTEECVITATSAGTRGLSTSAAVALYVTAVVGPGILTLPAAAAQKAGPLSLIALAALLAISVPAAFAFVHIHRATSTRAPTEQAGIQQYVTAAFGRRAGRVAAAWFYLGVPIGVPALALIGGAYVSAAVGGGRVTQLAAAWAIAGVAILANVRTARSSGALSLVLAVALVVLILGAAVVSIPYWRPQHLQDFAPNGVLAVVPASLTLMWVLTGWEASTNFVGLVRDPHRRLPRVIGITLVVVVVLYAAVALPEILVLGPFAGGTSAPVAAVLHAAIGDPAASVAALLAAVLALANSVAYLASLRELGTGFLPPRRSTGTATGPVRALLVPAAITVGGLLLASVTDLDVSWFVEVCAGSQVPVYVAALAAGLVLLRRRSRGWWTALVATIAVALLLIPAGPFLVVPLVIAIGVLVVDVARRR